MAWLLGLWGVRHALRARKRALYAVLTLRHPAGRKRSATVRSA
jgi:hypothetical protein